MKWGIIILVILGLVAAACAAFLVSTMGASPSTAKNSPAGAEVAMARKDLPAMTVITLNHIVKETVTRNDLPQGQRLSSPTRVIGRVLSVPVVEGQVLTESCFVTEGTGAQLAAAIPYGMRAFTVHLSSRAVPDLLLLYPGCVVDVVATYRLSSKDQTGGQALSTTMLHGIQVLAISGESVVSNPDDEEKGNTKPRSISRDVAVTLMVNPSQAKALQLASDNGNISLTIRNPLDKILVDDEPTVLNQGKIASLGTVLTPSVFADIQNEQDLLIPEPTGATDPNGNTRDPSKQAEGNAATGTTIPQQQHKPVEQSHVRRSAPPPRWGITVIRGQEKKVEELEIPED